MISPGIARTLDAAVLKPEFTAKEAAEAIEQSLVLSTITVCLRPCDIPLGTRLCEGTETAVCTVLGFPHGSLLTASKLDEAKRYLDLGVGEIDMVANYGWARSGMWDALLDEIGAMTQLTRPAGVPLKVIFETAQLDIATIVRLTELAVEAQADFVKTSTGFNGGGASDDAVRAMVATAAGRIQVKASGGIRNRDQAEHFLALGASRLGVNWSSCAAICHGTAADSEPTGQY